MTCLVREATKYQALDLVEGQQIIGSVGKCHSRASFTDTSIQRLQKLKVFSILFSEDQKQNNLVQNEQENASVKEPLFFLINETIVNTQIPQTVEVSEKRLLSKVLRHTCSVHQSS